MPVVRLLAIDNSSDTLSVALRDGAATIERSAPSGVAGAERALPMVGDLLAEAGVDLRALDAIAFGAGPGAFTGVRIACGIAQGLALGADLPVVAVGTLEALAQEAWRRHGAMRVFACTDARMREVYIAAYERRAPEHWVELRAPDVVAPDAVGELPPDAFAAGDGLSAHAPIAARFAEDRRDATLRATARAVADLAVPRWQRGAAVAARDAQPRYVRHRVALTRAEREAGARL
jgi:tRNA threonylcarbamoyladenosine biosynthesis protein TsaB